MPQGSSGGVEADPGLVSKTGDPLGPQHSWEAAKHAWQTPGRNHWNTLHDDLAPGDLGAVDGQDRKHYHAGVGQDLGGLVGLVIAWRDQAKHAAESLHRGSRVVVVGRLQQRTWTAEDGGARAVVEVVAEELGPRSWGRALGGRRRHRAGWPGRLERYVILSRHRPCTPVDRERY
jgi:Single-strand binding protein family